MYKGCIRVEGRTYSTGQEFSLLQIHLSFTAHVHAMFFRQEAVADAVPFSAFESCKFLH